MYRTLDSDIMQRVNACFLDRMKASQAKAQAACESGAALKEHMAEAFRNGAMKNVASLFLGAARTVCVEAQAQPEPANDANGAKDANGANVANGAKVTEDSAIEALELIAELVCTSKLDEADIEREKGVVIEEIAMTNDTPEDLVHEALCSLYYDGDALAYPVLGSQQSVGAFTKGMIRSYMGRRYRAENIVIAAAGNFNFVVAMW